MEGSSALRASAQPLLRTPARCQRLTKAFGSTRPARAPAARLMHGQRLHVRLQAESSPEFATSELAETAALDQLIDMLLSAKNSEELSQLVAQNIMSYDQRFWLRLATRSDTAAGEEEKQRLAALAKVVMQLVDAMVKRTEGQLNESAVLLQDILKAAADERGEWQLPLSAEKQAAMRRVMDANADKLDEALLSNAYAWLRKASEDKMDGMVALLQKALQVYAGRQLSVQQPGAAGADAAADAALSQLLAADEAEWAALVRQQAQQGVVSELSLLDALQRRMESVVLGLASGSYAQRVQAEYLKELEGRAKGVFAELAKQEA